MCTGANIVLADIAAVREESSAEGLKRGMNSRVVRGVLRDQQVDVFGRPYVTVGDDGEAADHDAASRTRMELPDDCR